MLIIYKDLHDVVGVIKPVATHKYTIDEIAKKAVPTGKPYKIVDNSAIELTDRTARHTWTILDEELTDGVGE